MKKLFICPLIICTLLLIFYFSSPTNDKIDSVSRTKTTESTRLSRNNIKLKDKSKAPTSRVNIKDAQSAHIFTDAPVNPIFYYSQYDGPWGTFDYGYGKTIAQAGCGPATMAMIVKSLNPEMNVTPKETAMLSLQDGYRLAGAGTSWDLFYNGFPKYNLKTQDISTDKDSIVGNLKQGKMIVISMHSGKAPEDDAGGSNTWTSGGHLICLRGVTPEGRVLVGDPASLDRSKKSWDYETSVKPFMNPIAIAVSK